MFRFIVLFSCFVVTFGYKEACGANEEMRCAQSCPPEKTCSNRDIQFDCALSKEPCQQKCVCKEGLLRNATGECVTVDQCEPSCKENEVYTDCKKSCPPETCFSIAAFFKCDSSEPCAKGCVCKPAYLRKNLDSPCIPTCQCPEMQNSPDCKK